MAKLTPARMETQRLLQKIGMDLRALRLSRNLTHKDLNLTTRDVRWAEEGKSFAVVVQLACALNYRLCVRISADPCE